MSFGFINLSGAEPKEYTFTFGGTEDRVAFPKIVAALKKISPVLEHLIDDTPENFVIPLPDFIAHYSIKWLYVLSVTDNKRNHIENLFSEDLDSFLDILVAIDFLGINDPELMKVLSEKDLWSDDNFFIKYAKRLFPAHVPNAINILIALKNRKKPFPLEYEQQLKSAFYHSFLRGDGWEYMLFGTIKPDMVNTKKPFNTIQLQSKESIQINNLNFTSLKSIWR